ncbi:MAG: multicopper oxidase domain-containing protein [Microthrixaceae bacterium]
MATDTRRDKQSMGVIIGVIAAVYLLGIGAIVGATALWGGSGSGGGAAKATTANIDLSEFKITGDLTVPAGKVTLKVHNKGSINHNLHVKELDKGTDDITAGSTATLELGELKPGKYTVVCTIAGHESSGMIATLTVTDGASAADGTDDGGSSGSSGGHEMTLAEGQKLDDAMMTQMATFGTDAAKTEGVGNQILQPTIDPDGTKVFNLTAEITDWEVEPGKVVKAWSYNGMVPGPWIKLNLGDRVRVHVTNKLPMGTDIHWHGVHLPTDQDGVAPYTQPLIKPNGGTYDYRFTATKPAVSMYHAHVHGEEAVPNGMFAPITIGEVELPLGRTISDVTIPNNVKPVLELPMVLNDAGTIGYSLNGKSFPATAPVVVNKGDWFVVHYYNEGLQVHPMHMHGFPQLVVAKDGIRLDNPYWADTILVSPGERYSVLIQATEPGTWVWHCHILNHVEQRDRMFGMASAVIVKDPSNPA